MTETTKEEVQYIGTDGTEYTKEEWDSPAIIGGPTRGQIEEWKKEHGPIYYYAHDSGVFLFRTLKREEYKSLKDEENTEDMLSKSEIDRVLMLEETITKKATLFPENYEELLSSNGIVAGIPTTLADMIYEKSGFSQVAVPIKL